MCNDYQQHLDWNQYCRAMAEAGLGMPPDPEAKGLRNADDVKVGDTATIMIAEANTVK